MSEHSPQLNRKELFQQEFAPVLRWYKESCDKLPTMRVDITPLTDNKESKINPSYFSYANVDVTSEKGSWQQGGIIQEGQGLTVLLTDPEGRTFVTVGQEPLAANPIVRSPLQTSAEKLKRKSDPVMKVLLDELGSDALNHIPLSSSPTDGNRMKSDVQYGSLAVSKELATTISKRIPAGRWVTPKEFDALTVMGITNGNLNIGRSITEAQRRLQSL